MVRGTNHCQLNVFAGADASQAIVISTIDNLGKGASGQAVQNMNRMFGWAETTGLNAIPIFP
jgi:N-acetyl-gamma-glutamyl-phosphate reductase